MKSKLARRMPSGRARPRRGSRLFAGCALLVALAACSEQELYSKLSERQANEMVAVLRASGIEASKVASDDHFAIMTAERDFGVAVRTLSAHGLPRERFDSIGEVFKREGFVSSPLEERARLLHAMSQEMSNTLANIDGVVTARVHLVVPESNPLVDTPRPASASVFIKHRPDRDLAAKVPQIKALVVNSIEGLAYDHVTVALFAAERLPVAPASPPGAARMAGTGMTMPIVAGGGFGLAAWLGGTLLWWRGRRSSTGHRAGPATTAASTGGTEDA